MNFRPSAIIAALISILIMQSCISRKEISYFQIPQDSTSVQELGSTYEAALRQGDIISIQVTSLSNQASSFFNETDSRAEGQGMTTYLVSASGTISFPLLGEISVLGKTTKEVTENLRIALAKYLVEPGVRIRLLSFKITVLGEVARPGVYPIQSERVSLIEAIAMAGDLTIYGKRKNVMLIREENGKRSFMRVDLTSPQLFESEMYELHNNDVVYIEPGSGKVASAEDIYRILPIVLSGLTALGLFLQRVL